MTRRANLLIEDLENISNIIPERHKSLFLDLESPWVQQPSIYPFREYCVLILWNWQISLHWLYKFKFDTNYKVPEPKRGRLAYMKEFGIWLGSIFNLCDITLPWSEYLDVDQIQYPDSERWFKLIAHEIKNTQLNPDEINNTQVHHKGKSEINKDLRKDLGILRKYENPYDENKRPHTWALIDASLRLFESRRVPNFGKDQWTIKKKEVPFGCEGFLHAYSRMLAAEANPKRQTIFIQDNQLFIRKGRGSSSLLIRPFMDENP